MFSREINELKKFIKIYFIRVKIFSVRNEPEIDTKIEIFICKI